MTEDGAEKTADQLRLRSRLSEMAQLPAWIDSLSVRHGIPASLHFSIYVCLEEVLSNVILHGYDGKDEGSVFVRFLKPQDDSFLFIVEDDAPLYNPLDQPELPALNPHESIRVGGHGLRMLRRFSHALEYQPLPKGNRLKISFSSADPEVRPV